MQHSLDRVWLALQVITACASIVVASPLWAAPEMATTPTEDERNKACLVLLEKMRSSTDEFEAVIEMLGRTKVNLRGLLMDRSGDRSGVALHQIKSGRGRDDYRPGEFEGRATCP